MKIITMLAASDEEIRDGERDALFAVYRELRKVEAKQSWLSCNDFWIQIKADIFRRMVSSMDAVDE